jgi:site-specific DNA-methyltransferase (adenine-specific)
MTPFFESQEPEVRLYNGDVLAVDFIPPDAVDLIVTSPPYNVEVVYGVHRDDLSYSEYLEFCEAWLRRCYQWLKPDGRLCLNIPLDKNKGGQQSVGADLTILAKRLGYQYHATIVWNEGNISRRTAWGSWLSASAPYVIAPVELIVVLYKKEWKKMSGSRQSDITQEEFIEWTNGLWTFNGESKKRVGHPAPFPLELPRRCIKLFSYVGDLVLDPFVGSGTTLLAAIMHNRRCIGIEIERRYCELARQRIEEYLRTRQYALLISEEKTDYGAIVSVEEENHTPAGDGILSETSK